MTEETKQKQVDDELKQQSAEGAAEEQESSDAAPDAGAAGESSGEAAIFDKTVNPDDVPEEDAEAAMMAMMEDLPQDEANANADDIDFGQGTAARAEFQQLSEPARSGEVRNIDLLMDVNLPVSIELGRTKMSIADILALGPGSVVELSKLAGEPVDLLVNYKIIARGEVVVVDENFGVRITQLMTPEQRLKALGEQ